MLQSLLLDNVLLNILVPTAAVYALSDLSAVGELLAVEELQAGMFSEKRKCEFKAGRYCARKALRSLGIEDFPLRISEYKYPIWPTDIIGSITHCKHYCGAAVVKTNVVSSLGIDVEECGAVAKELWQIFCSKKELDWLTTLPAKIQKEMAAVIFSGKESFFKCQFPLTHTWIDFKCIELSITEGRFDVYVNGKKSRQFSGAYGFMRGKELVLSSVIAA